MVFDDCQLSIWNSGNVNIVDDKNMQLMCFVDDVDSEYNRLKESEYNVVFIHEPMVQPWGVKDFMFYDLDGNTISFLQPL